MEFLKKLSANKLILLSLFVIIILVGTALFIVNSKPGYSNLYSNLRYVLLSLCNRHFSEADM